MHMPSVSLVEFIWLAQFPEDQILYLDVPPLEFFQGGFDA